jgi:hypothetical protein
LFSILPWTNLPEIRANQFVEHDFRSLGRRTMLLNAREVYYEAASPANIFLSRTSLPATVQYCPHSQKINGRLGKRVRPVSVASWAQDCSLGLVVSVAIFRAVFGKFGCEMLDFRLSNIAQQNIQTRVNMRDRRATS